MRLVELLAEIRHRDIKLWVEGDQLRFSAPPEAMTSTLRGELARKKPEIVRFLRAPAHDDRPGDRPPIRPAPDDGPLPLSFGQEQLWYAHQVDPDGAAYNITEAAWIGPGLDVETFRRAVAKLFSRHSALRTTFVAHDRGPRQVVHDERGFEIDLIDLRHTDDKSIDAEVRRVVDRDAQTPFDLAADHLLRVTVAKLPNDAHLVVVTTHHIACDGWSMGILFRELAALYAGYANGAEPQVPDLPVQYSDFAAWQRRVISGETERDLVSYWKGRLAGCATELDLPLDRPRPAVQSFRGEHLAFEIPAATAAALGAIGGAAGATPFMTLFAAFASLLGRYTGQRDINVGTPVAVYNVDELEPLIGLWLNVLVLRADLSGDPSFTELLGQVRETALAAYEHQELPFHRLIEALEPPRDPSRNPLFQVMFVQQLQNAPSRRLTTCGLEVRPLVAHGTTSKLDLTLSVAEEDDGRFGCWFEFNVDLFEHATIERLRDHYLCLLASIAEDPDRPLSRLTMLPDDELDLYVHRWNDTAVVWPGPDTVQEMIREQATRTPDSIAAEHRGAALSYAELDRRANRLAHHLAALGVGPRRRVGIFAERGLDALVGIVGILKAGGAYLPLDPDYPRERLEFVFRDADVDVLVTHASLRDLLPGVAGQSVVLLDRDNVDDTGPFSDPLPVDGAEADDPAYVLYTSGSTGRPKGAALPQRGLVNLLRQQAEAPGIGRQDVLLAVTTLSFDIATLEMLLPLTVGARVVIADRETATDARALSDAIESSRATFMQATPATWRMLYEAGWSGCPRLKVLSGGEALTTDLTEFLMGSTKELWNQYGPTETTIYSTGGKVTSAVEPISIGRPLANTTIRLLDADGNLVPIGVVGEIHIGGVGLAPGYLNRPEMTAEKFVDDPYADDPQARLYRTGDLAKLASDGSIAYLGRVDNQVKVRGVRIELGEVEAVLRDHTAVSNVVVTVREFGPDDRRLIAYFVPQDGAEPPTGSELRQWTKEKLPKYMVPAVFLVLDAFPMTPNGKLDRARLPEPDVFRVDPSTELIPPATSTEEMLVKAFSRLLRIEEVSTSDSFFDLGGHSLLAVRLISKIEDEWNLRLGIRDIALQTLAQLAATCDAKRGV